MTAALVRHGIATARRLAVRELRAAIRQATGAGHTVASCAVLVSDPMPEWTVAEILAVHFRMHKAEGVLFRDALAHATARCGVTLRAIPEKRLDETAARALGSSVHALKRHIASLGKSAGPPWGKDQKDASLAALVAMRERR